MNLSNASNDATPTASTIQLVVTDQGTRTGINEIANLMKVNVNFHDNGEASFNHTSPKTMAASSASFGCWE